MTEPQQDVSCILILKIARNSPCRIVHLQRQQRIHQQIQQQRQRKLTQQHLPIQQQHQRLHLPILLRVNQMVIIV